MPSLVGSEMCIRDRFGNMYFLGKLAKSGIPGWFLNKIGYLFFRDGVRLRTSAKRLQNALWRLNPLLRLVVSSLTDSHATMLHSAVSSGQVVHQSRRIFVGREVSSAAAAASQSSQSPTCQLCERSSVVRYEQNRVVFQIEAQGSVYPCLLYTSPSPRD